MLSVLLIAFSLSLDAFAVSVSCGISVEGFSMPQAVRLGVWFGGFQFMMPVVGWFLGIQISTYIQAFDYLVAFGLLTLIGGRMILEAFKGDEECTVFGTLSVRRLSALAVATSIDALAVGVPMAFMQVRIFSSAAVIGLVAFFMSVLGGILGKQLGSLFRRQATVAGGLVLIGIGTKMLIQHFI